MLLKSVFFSQKILSKWRTDKFYKNETFCFVGFWNDSICFLFVPQTEAAADTEKELFVVDDNDVLVEILVFQETVLYSEVGKNANNSIDPKVGGSILVTNRVQTGTVVPLISRKNSLNF